jgi:Response regulator containing a CheY-like receiver domain and an HTH DNA-binding domain
MKKDGTSEISMVVVLTLYLYDFVGVSECIENYMATHHPEKLAGLSVSWYRSTIEIDHSLVSQCVDPVIVVIDYPGSESNWLLHKTLSMYFSKIIFLSRGKESADSSVYFINLRQNFRAIQEKLGRVICLNANDSYAFNNSYLHWRENLTAKEDEILVLILKGESMRAIAEVMEISIPTAYSYRKKICDKAGVRKIYEIIRKYKEEPLSQK